MIVIPLLPRSNSDKQFPKDAPSNPTPASWFCCYRARAISAHFLTSYVFRAVIAMRIAPIFCLHSWSRFLWWSMTVNVTWQSSWRGFRHAAAAFWVYTQQLLTNRGWWRALVIKLNHVTSSPVKGVTLNLACHADPMWYQKGTEDRKRSESVISYHPHRNSCSKVKTMNSWDTWKVLMGTPTVLSDRLDHSDHSLKRWLWWNSRKWG